MSERSRKGPSMVPSWIRDEPPSVEECQAAAEVVLERGYVMTTVVGEDCFDDVSGEAPPVDEYRISSRPQIVGGGS